jgi:hypothetical protein
MASAAQSLSSPIPYKNWTPCPNFYSERLHPVLSNLENSIFLIILTRTLGTRGKPSWAVINIVQLARQLKFSEMGVGQAIKQLLSKGLVRVSNDKEGKSHLYQIAFDNLREATERLYGERQPRKLTLRKRPGRAETTSPEIPPLSESNVDDSIATCELSEFRNTQLEKEREEHHEISPPMQIVDCPDTASQDQKELADWCLVNITPKLGDCPPEKVIAKTIEVLGRTPLESFKNQVMRRFKKITGWGLLVMIAEDARKGYYALSSIPLALQRSQYHLDWHWASCTEVRALYADVNTPQSVKNELTLMWPELLPKGQRPGPPIKDPEMFYRLKAKAREFDERMKREQEQKSKS